MDPLQTMILLLQLCTLALGPAASGPVSMTQHADVGAQQQLERRMALLGAGLQVGHISDNCRHLVYQDLGADLLFDDDAALRLDGVSQTHARTRLGGSSGFALGLDADLQLEQQSARWNVMRASRIGSAPFRRYRAETRVGLLSSTTEEDAAPQDNSFAGLQLIGLSESLRYVDDARSRGPGFDRYHAGARLHSGGFLMHDSVFFDGPLAGEMALAEVVVGRYGARRPDLPDFGYVTLKALSIHMAGAAGAGEERFYVGFGMEFVTQWLGRDGVPAQEMFPIAWLLDLYLRWPGRFALMLDLDLGEASPDPATRLWAQRYEAHLHARWTPGRWRTELGILAGTTNSQLPEPSEDDEEADTMSRQRLGGRVELGYRLFANLELLAFYEQEYLPASWLSNRGGEPGEFIWQSGGIRLRLLEASRKGDVDRRLPVTKD